MTTGDGTDEPALLTAFLTGRDVPCPRCGYNLRALVGERCPECGDLLRLQVGLAHPRDAAYLTLLAGACSGVAGSGMFTLIALSAAPTDWWFEEPAAWALMGELVMTAVMLAVVLLTRRRFRRASPRWQWGWAVAAWVAVVAMSGSVVLLFNER